MARKTMIAICFLGLAAASSVAAAAGVDRSAGICAAYLTLLQKPNAAETALSLADNRQRALQFATTRLSQIMRWAEQGEWTANMQRGFAVEGVRACQAVGIRPSDFPN